MNVALRHSRRIIGSWAQPISINRDIPLPVKLTAPAYRHGRVLTWEPAPPPNHRGQQVAIPFWCDTNAKGDIEMLIDDQYEDLYRTHPLFRASPPVS